jgi:hypothetical protein
LCHISKFDGIVTPTICKHVIILATKVSKPTVGVCIVVILSGTTSLQTWASWLFLLRVTAIVLTLSSVARRAISIFAFVLPVTEIKQYVLSFMNFELNRSDGL